MGAGLKKKLGLIKKHNGICHWCGRPCKIIVGDMYCRYKFRRLPKRAATVDHLINRLESQLPEKQRILLENAVLSCYDCNQRKGLEAQNRTYLKLRLLRKKENV